MKQLKVTLIVLILSAFFFSSCKDESVKNNTNTVESVAAKSAMMALKSHFNTDGTLNRDANPANNIVFDFCFDFVYPITLSYNNDTEVTVENFEGLVAILVNMTDEMYVDGISFPFQVEVFNQDTDSFEIETIENDSQFLDLLESCSINDSGEETDECVCPEIYDPVCVMVTNPNGENVTVSFPNMCYAECEGFTDADVVECEISNPVNIDVFGDCFDFVYPISVITLDGETIVIEDDDDFSNTLFTNYSFNFIYPITIALNGGNTILNNEEDFIAILEDCAGNNECECPDVYDPVCIEVANGDIEFFNNMCEAMCEGFSEEDLVNCNPSGSDCSISEITATVGECFSTTAYYITIDFNIQNPPNEFFTVVFQDGTVLDGLNYSDLPITLEVDVNEQNTDYLTVIADDLGCDNVVDWEVPSCN